MTKTKKEREAEQTAQLFGYAVVALLAIAFVLLPGSVLLGAIALPLDLELDRGQWITFSAIGSVAVLGVLIGVVNRHESQTPTRDGLGFYLLLCIALAIVLAVMHFGFKSKLPSALLGNGTTPEVEAGTIDPSAVAPGNSAPQADPTFEPTPEAGSR